MTGKAFSRTARVATALSLACCLLSACDTVQIGWVETSVPGKWEAHYERFSGSLDRKVSLDEGDRLTVVYDSRVESGQLELSIVGPGDEVAVDIPEGESGETTLDARTSGSFHIQVTGDDTKGEFSLEWTVE